MDAKMIDHQQAVKTMMAERYLLGELSESERDAYEAHLFDCQICFAQVKAGTQFVNYLKHTGVEQPVTVLKPRWYQSMGRGFQLKPAFALAFLLFFAVGLNVYQGLSLRRANAPQIVSVTTLHSEARGDSSAVIASRRAAFELRVVFQADAGYRLNRVQVLNDAGQEVASAPVSNLQGNELQVRLDAGRFHSGKYMLVLKATGPSSTVETTVNEYPFELTLQD